MHDLKTFFSLTASRTGHVWNKQACYHTQRVPSPKAFEVQGKRVSQGLRLRMMVSSYRAHARVALRCGWCVVHLCVLSKQRKASQHLLLLLYYHTRFFCPVTLRCRGMCEIGAAKCTFYVLPSMKRVEHFFGYKNVRTFSRLSRKNIQQKMFAIKTRLTVR